MIPLTDIDALSTSDSNHMSRKSTALMVISLRFMLIASVPPFLIVWPSRSSFMSSRGFQDVGSGAGESMISRTNWATLVIVRLNSG